MQTLRFNLDRYYLNKCPTMTNAEDIATCTSFGKGAVTPMLDIFIEMIDEEMVCKIVTKHCIETAADRRVPHISLT